MDDDEIREHRFRFFTEKGVEIALEQDKAFAALFTAVIAGLLALVVYQKVSFWSGTFFLVADALAIVGLAWNLLHMGYTAKLMLAFAAYFAGEEHVPNVVERLGKVTDVIPRTRVWAQRAYISQLVYLFLAVSAASIGLAIELWDYVRFAGMVIAIAFSVMIVGAATLGLFIRRWVLKRKGA